MTVATKQDHRNLINKILRDKVRILKPFHSKDLISYSPYFLPYNFYDESSGNLVFDQPSIP